MFLETAYALAATNPSYEASVTKAYEISELIQTSIAVIVLVSGVLCVFYILWGGVMLILSGGREDRTKPAMASIKFSAVGLIVIVIALFVMPKIGDLLGLNVSRYVSPQVVFGRIQTLAIRIFGGNDSLSTGIPSSDGKPVLPSDFSDL